MPSGSASTLRVEVLHSARSRMKYQINLPQAFVVVQYEQRQTRGRREGPPTKSSLGQNSSRQQEALKAWFEMDGTGPLGTRPDGPRHGCWYNSGSYRSSVRSFDLEACANRINRPSGPVGI